jgi:hypothetical protein
LRCCSVLYKGILITERSRRHGDGQSFVVPNSLNNVLSPDEIINGLQRIAMAQDNLKST